MDHRRVTPAQARELWREVETIHAVTYFSAEAQAAATEVGLKGFWMGYFGFRAAPMGPVGPAVVTATFANFAPSIVARAIPDAWERAKPADMVYARSASAATVLRTLCEGIDDAAEALNPILRGAVAGADPTGRPLFAANQQVATRSDAVASLWQHCTSLREHRGDGHISAFVAAGLSGLDAHQLQVGDGVIPGEALRSVRGWSEDEWAASGASMVGRGLLDAAGALTAAGRSVKDAIEDTTDHLAAEAWRDVDFDAVHPVLAGVADGIRAASLIPTPNPIGLW